MFGCRRIWIGKMVVRWEDHLHPTGAMEGSMAMELHSTPAAMGLGPHGHGDLPGAMKVGPAAMELVLGEGLRRYDNPMTMEIRPALWRPDLRKKGAGSESRHGGASKQPKSTLVNINSQFQPSIPQTKRGLKEEMPETHIQECSPNDILVDTCNIYRLGCLFLQVIFIACFSWIWWLGLLFGNWNC
jgi:hypothetical protein